MSGPEGKRTPRDLLEPRYAVPIILLLATAIRLLPMRSKYLLGVDPYFHLAYIRYALSHGWAIPHDVSFGKED